MIKGIIGMPFQQRVIGAMGALLAAAGLLGFAVSSSNAAPARASSSATCGVTSVVRDYLAPLRGMAIIREVPLSRKLPFGPKGMELAPTDEGLQVGAGSLGFFLSDEAIEQRRHLDWIVETQLSRVDVQGRVISSKGVKKRRLGTIEGNKIKAFSHSVSSTPAFYRVDINFFTVKGHRLLGKYGHYVRVVRARRGWRVEIEKSSVLPGEFAKARLINVGTLPIYSAAYDYGFDVQAFTGTRWVTLADNPPIGRVLKRMQVLGAGLERRNCLRYLVPESAPPGRYRFDAEGRPGEGSLLSAEFRVRSQP